MAESGTVESSGSGTRAATLAILRLAQPRARWFLPGLAAGVASALSAVALLATSAWLITRAAEQPPILYLSMAVVGVRAFALGRSAFRYLDRLSSHDAAFRQLSLLRVGVFSRIIPLAPAGLHRRVGEIGIALALGGAARRRAGALGQRAIAAFVIADRSVDVQANRIGRVIGLRRRRSGRRDRCESQNRQSQMTHRCLLRER